MPEPYRAATSPEKSATSLFRGSLIEICRSAAARSQRPTTSSRADFVRVVCALAMTVTGFFLCAVGGYLVGLVGASNQPLSGLTLSSLIIAALLLVAIGYRGPAASRQCLVSPLLSRRPVLSAAR